MAITKVNKAPEINGRLFQTIMNTVNALSESSEGLKAVGQSTNEPGSACWPVLMRVAETDSQLSGRGHPGCRGRGGRGGRGRCHSGRCNCRAGC